MFSLAISLLLLGIAGVGYLFCPAFLLQLKTEAPVGFFGVWQSSLDSFAVPASLFLLIFSKGRLIRLAAFFWGLWMVIATLIVFTGIRDYAPEATPYGNIFLVCVLILSSAITIFSAMTFYHPPPPPTAPQSSGKSSSDGKVTAGNISSENPTPE